MRSAQSTLRSAEMIQVNSRTCSSWWPKPTCQNAIQDSTQEIISSDVVMISAAREPAAARLGRRMMIVVAAGLVMDDGMIARMRRRVVIVVRRLRAGKARARTGERDRGAQDGAEQRQKDDRQIHAFSPHDLSENRFPLFGIMRQPFIRLMSSTAIEPRLRK